MSDVGNELDQQAAVHQAIQTTADPDLGEGTLLTRWVVIAEWMRTDGSRPLMRLAADGMQVWEARGLMYEGLNEGGWGEIVEEEE